MIDERLRRHSLGYWEAVDKPGAEELKAYYEKQYYELELGNFRSSYTDNEMCFIRNKMSQRAALVDQFRPLSREGRMLDVGCGEGFALAHFRNNGWRVEGIDYSATGMSLMNPDCLDVLETGDMMSLLHERICASNKYDLVWCTNVLEHAEDPPRLMRQLRRLVCADGILVVTVPNDFSSLQQYALENEDINHPFWIALPDHLAYFDRDSLDSVAHATGWSRVALLADFPIDWFLLNPRSNYVADRSFGPEAHLARVALENVLAQQPVEYVNKFYAALAEVGMGRNITAYLAPTEIFTAESYRP
jgi:2-polyprenyl-3-methyl-5-hydroxy-6-metoxy-1,4-benzoquinol methylase